ncbi:class I SAM-dependent methyltransferase [Streptomyces sp. CA-249302]|uniref:class I SAM-dependent methyltransferase n=1 Tax=Streptomyces sp. CA-249302 TaxID=3240058 RepID=UPI003D8C4D22
MLDEDGYFGESVAANYDKSSAGMFASDVVEPAVDLLAGLAGDGRALELGVGTGRIALPLAERGVEVHGIEMSRAMVQRLRAKPGGDAIGVTIGDFATAKVDAKAGVEADVEVDGGFSLAYLVFNTIMNLTSQDAQVDCFRNVAEHLRPGGHFVVEVGVPDLRRLPPGQNAVPFRVGDGRVGFDLYDDLATQSVSSHHVRVDKDGRGSYLAVPFRYVWPSELDLMARLAGMRLRERWDGWTREPFTGESRQHVSVWEKVAE